MAAVTHVAVTHGGGPADARTLARMHLASLAKGADRLLDDEQLKLDDYSRAHLLDCKERIQQALQAGVTVPSVN